MGIVLMIVEYISVSEILILLSYKKLQLIGNIINLDINAIYLIVKK